MPLGRLRRVAPQNHFAATIPPRPLSEAVRIAWITDSHYRDDVIQNDPTAPGAIVQSRHFYTVRDKMQSFARHVNATTPHGALATGDLIDEGRSSFATWRSYWDLITAPSATKMWVPGNHDFSYAPPGTSYMDATAEDMGVLANPIVGGSRFNRAQVISNGTFSVRVLLIDTNRDPTGGGGDCRASTTGTIPDDTMTWIQDQLTTSPETVILLASHHGPHTFGINNYFNLAHAQNLRDVVAAVKGFRPIKVVSLFGHNHIQNRVSNYSTLGSKLPGLLAPALVELSRASSTDLYVWDDGTYWTSIVNLQYPHVA